LAQTASEFAKKHEEKKAQKDKKLKEWPDKLNNKGHDEDSSDSERSESDSEIKNKIKAKTSKNEI